MDYRVVKEDDVFFLTDKSGNIPENHPYGPGLYAKDTRFLSQFELTINGREPILLSSTASENYYTTILLTNPHMKENGVLELWRESVELERKRFICQGVCYEMVTATNYYPQPINFTLGMHMDADFIDMFLIRGFQSGNVGKRTASEVSEKGVTFHYVGADELKRSTTIRWDQLPSEVTENEVSFDIALSNGEKQTIVFAIAPGWGGEAAVIQPAGEALERLLDSYTAWNEETVTVASDREEVGRLFERGLADMRVLLTDAGHGPMPMAGLPWFAVPFGRDSLIASLQMLPFRSDVARATLETMAMYQGTKVDPWRDEQPGKIMHELRAGELANTNQVPFTPYYGTIDATPLFLILLVEYVKWTGDLAFFEKMEGTVARALSWIDEYGDRDGDSFLEYHQESAKGIANQGWKDSADSVVHRNGNYAKTPIALAEVQGYVYQAKRGLAALYETSKNESQAQLLRAQAEQLRENYEKAFWMEDLGFYAIALDQEKKQVGTLTTNPGHTLLSEMLMPERAKQVSDTLVSDPMFSGYGIRTMGSEESAYNPMSYHDGSVWPHDNSLIILGMAKLGHTEQARTAMEGLMKAAHQFEYDRLPELFCGYSDEQSLVPYPVACSPQAWAAGTSLVLIQAMLGIFPNALKREVSLSPVLLEGMNELTVRGIQLADGQLDIRVSRTEAGPVAEILTNTTGCHVHVCENR
ncbi:amylo-alpha-1,6-glucosidase [Shouchella shacheensis]|uniref:amylo-alpha-1,6-glucosidase n=1 Tax=Shouchella shacheensis TaxID=1649580 RepID=UPI0007401064|nr:amylo-alpha-1,6-glucosidase [Shouchella shacheensis]